MTAPVLSANRDVGHAHHLDVPVVAPAEIDARRAAHIRGETSDEEVVIGGHCALHAPSWGRCD